MMWIRQGQSLKMLRPHRAKLKLLWCMEAWTLFMLPKLPKWAQNWEWLAMTSTHLLHQVDSKSQELVKA